MLLPKSRVFAISRQTTQLFLYGTRNSPHMARFARSAYSTVKQTGGLNDTMVSRADDEPETLPPLKTVNAEMVSAVDQELSLPEKVLRPSYPSPHLDDHQVQEFLNPLYSRAWGIQLLEKKGPSLALDLQFSKFQHLCAFLPLLNEVMKKERVSNPMCGSFWSNSILTTHKHHCFVAYEFKVLRLRSHTHDAIANRGDVDIVPGVTMHDVALAITIERQLEPFFQRGEVTRLSRKFQPGTLPTSIRCRACGGIHHFRNCPDRHGIRPDRPCMKCGDNHWTMDCPHNNNPWSMGS